MVITSTGRLSYFRFGRLVCFKIIIVRLVRLQYTQVKVVCIWIFWVPTNGVGRIRTLLGPSNQSTSVLRKQNPASISLVPVYSVLKRVNQNRS